MTDQIQGPTAGLAQLRSRLLPEIGKVVVGQTQVVDTILVGLAVGGHVLLEGPPGVAKTLLVSSLARAFHLDFKRVQFTPDMLPSDVTGTLTLKGDQLAFRAGPVFTNLLLADEINRTPPKTQASLLEAMQEGQVSVDGVAHKLPDPFIVIATENPIEYEGTYPLPEAQLDRFLMKLDVGYPTLEQEEALLKLQRSGVTPTTIDEISAVASAADLAMARSEVDAVSVSDAIVTYVSAITRRTRELPSVSLGASPRSSVHLLAASKAIAAMFGRAYVIPDDVMAMTVPVLKHRLVLTPEAELDRFRPEQALQTVLASVPVPR